MATRRRLATLADAIEGLARANAELRLAESRYINAKEDTANAAEAVAAGMKECTENVIGPQGKGRRRVFQLPNSRRVLVYSPTGDGHDEWSLERIEESGA